MVAELVEGKGRHQSSEADGNRPKRVALDTRGRNQHEADAAVDACGRKEEKDRQASEPAATFAATDSASTEPTTMAPPLKCGAKAHSPAVSPVDCEGLMGPAASFEQANNATVAQPGKADDGLHVSRLHLSAKTSPMNGMTDTVQTMGTDDDGIQQPSPSAFRRLSSRTALNLG